MNMHKYADLLLRALRVKDKDYLFIEIPNYLEKFRECLEKAAQKYALKEVHFEITYPFKEHGLLRDLDYDDIIKNPLFDRSIYNHYAKLDAAFLFIRSMIPNLMSDIPAEKQDRVEKYRKATQEEFSELYDASRLHWTMAVAANRWWAEEALKISEEELWDYIYDICLVKGRNPYRGWFKKLAKLDRLTKKLNKYHFKKLKYHNSLGTDLVLTLPKKHRWCSGKNKDGVINNMPTEEIFTAPRYDKTEGVVFSSKPLIYNNNLIDGIKLEFKKGRVVKYDAKVGKKYLANILKIDKNSSYLGECALVDRDSAISKKRLLFEETLYDENAACHLALGRGFNECIRHRGTLDSKTLLKRGINFSQCHVDFMIGTDDLSITGITKSEEEVPIMKDGHFCDL